MKGRKGERKGEGTEMYETDFNKHVQWYTVHNVLQWGEKKEEDRGVEGGEGLIHLFGVDTSNAEFLS